MAFKTDKELIESVRNAPRFFVENSQVAWVLLGASLLWGVFGYLGMPQRKDPYIPVHEAVAITPWPGASAEQVEQLVTKPIEEKVAGSSHVDRVESVSRTNVSIVYVWLDENLVDTSTQLDDVKDKLDTIGDLPNGAGPIQFIKDFGDTAALMLTVASPRVDDTEVSIRAREIQQTIEEVRASAQPGGRFTVVVCLDSEIPARLTRPAVALFAQYAREHGLATDLHLIEKPGFVAVDGRSDASESTIHDVVQQFMKDRLQSSELYPDTWRPVVIRDPAETEARLAQSAGFKYTYRQLDDFTDLLERTLKTSPQVAKVSRVGLLNQAITLSYSQDRLAAYGIRPAALPDLLAARNITLPGGEIEVGGRNVPIEPSGELKSADEIGRVLVTTSKSGSPVYLRDLVDIVSGYEHPARFLNYLEMPDQRREWQRMPAVTLAVTMRTGEKIGDFARSTDALLKSVRSQLPPDLIIERTSDQPTQVRENIHLFMTSLLEAVILVVIVSLIGFWDWRSALLMALSIPITLAITFGLMNLMGLDLQQVSIASLIIALGLLVDVPVVAGDAIKRQLGAGRPAATAGWLGPTRLTRAIFFATLTNIVAYLPFLALSGSVGRFLYTLPVVVTLSLMASYAVAMVFVPLLGSFLLKPCPEPSLAERRSGGFFALYYRVGAFAIGHRWQVLGCSLLFLIAGGICFAQLKQQFFPKDLSKVCYVDVWMPDDAPLASTNAAATRAEAVIRSVADRYGETHPDQAGRPRQVLESLTSFVGGGGPRFWFSVEPETEQPNYAQILINVKDNHDTNRLVGPLQEALSSGVPGALIDVRQLETGKPVGVPVAVRISGPSIKELRSLGEKAAAIFRAVPSARRVRDDWGSESFVAHLRTDPDRANLAGISNMDVAASSAFGMSGYPVTTLREGDKQIPVTVQLRMDERSQPSDIQNLYVYSSRGDERVPSSQVSDLSYGMQIEKIRRRDQFPTITVSCFAADGVLPSQVLNAARQPLDALASALPSGYHLEFGGEKEEQDKGFLELAVVLGISVLAIYMALVVQFRHAVKPLIVFAAIPFGIAGSIGLLWLMNAPFGFMAFLGIASLIGVIVSHIIVLFDFIEEAAERGQPLRESLLDAGIQRLRPVMLTVAATVIALVPLASHGGPLWEPLCFAQIGGLSVATFVTLILVPVIYAIFVEDLRVVRWKERTPQQARL